MPPPSHPVWNKQPQNHTCLRERSPGWLANAQLPQHDRMSDSLMLVLRHSSRDECCCRGQQERVHGVQAYSISVPATIAMPHSGTLLAQMLMRTAAITSLAPDSLDPAFCEWWHERVRCPVTSTAVCCLFCLEFDIAVWCFQRACSPFSATLRRLLYVDTF